MKMIIRRKGKGFILIMGIILGLTMIIVSGGFVFNVLFGGSIRENIRILVLGHKVNVLNETV